MVAPARIASPAVLRKVDITDLDGLDPPARLVAAFWVRVILDLDAGDRATWDWLVSPDFAACVDTTLPDHSPADWRDLLLRTYWRPLL